MRKIFAIFTALLLLSCSTNHDEVIVRVKQNPTTKITKEQALKNLYGELKIIDAETRAGGEARKVKSIKSLEGAKTRSGNALDNDLLYIVEFEEGQGSAVLAADNRLEPVIAVLDIDVMTAEDFSSDDMDDIGVYMASMIGEYANYA
ncbi:MAG: Spi family protease inhibitor, partial [Alistipes sp.]|nr:Spi family protease inhibitor [Alistipes sp.]